MDVEGANLKYLLPSLERATGVSVKAQPLPWTAAHQKLLTAFAGGTLPDIVMIPNSWVAELAMLEAVRPLPAVAAASVERDAFAGVAAGFRAGGGLRAAPWTVDTAVQYVRRDVLARAGYDAPPPRLDDWKRMLAAVKRTGAAEYGVLMQLNWPDHLMHIAAQGDAPLLRDNDSRGAFSAPGFRAALAFYVSLFEEGLAPKVSSLEAGDPVAELARGFVASYASGAWTLAELKRRPAELPPERWSLAAMPGWTGPGRTIVAGSGLALSRTVEDPARAVRVIEHLTRPDVLGRFHQIAGVLPARPEAWRLPALNADATIAVFADQLTRAHAMPNIPEWPRISTEVQLMAERVVRGLMTQDAAVAEMDRAADRLLSKRRWLLDRGRIAA